MKRMFLNRVLVAGCGFAALSGSVLMAPRAAVAQSGAHTIYLWDGGGASDSGVAVHKWGNGKFEIKKPIDYPSQSALLVTTHNFYEGARFLFTRPVDLTPYRQDGILRLRLRSESATTRFSTPFTSRNRNNATAGGGFNPGSFSPPGGFSSPGGFSPNAPGVPPGGNPSGGTDVPNPYIQNPSGGFPGASGPSGPYGGPSGFGGTPGVSGTPGFGGRGQYIDPSQVVPPISQIQVIMQLEKGALFGQFDFSAASEQGVRPDSFGWQSFALPFSSLRATPGASGALRSIVLTGNSEGTFFVGQVALAPSGTVSVSIRRSSDAPGTQQTEITTTPQTPLSLVADVETGASDAVVEWNFDADNSGSLPASKAEQPISGPSLGGGSGFSGRGGGYPGWRGGSSPGGGYSGGSSPGGSSPGGSYPGGGYPGGSYPGGSYPGAPGTTGVPGAGAISMNLPRLDSRGLVASFTYPNEEQDYRVEVTVRNRLTRSEIGKASVIVHVRSAS